jgi:hypothetical protein
MVVLSPTQIWKPTIGYNGSADGIKSMGREIIEVELSVSNTATPNLI